VDDVANLTLSIDETVLDEARRAAARRGTTVNAVVRDYLTSWASREARIEGARRKLAELAERSTATIGPRDWTRDDLHDRKYNRVSGA
jgi:hypothetical protein